MTVVSKQNLCASQYQDLHCSEPWFHGRLKEGRPMAERLIYDYCAETGGTDGTFLVRDSDTCATGYTLSFWYVSATPPRRAAMLLKHRPDLCVTIAAPPSCWKPRVCRFTPHRGASELERWRLAELSKRHAHHTTYTTHLLHGHTNDVSRGRRQVTDVWAFNALQSVVLSACC